jgi:alkyl hydroperoxide reductase subunit AhpF
MDHFDESYRDQGATVLTGTGRISVPRRVVMIGGSAVGVELGQMLARFGSQVPLLERSENLLSREDPRVGELVGDRLVKDGVDVRTGVSATSVRRDADGSTVSLDDATEVTCDAIVIGIGRRPCTADLGLQTIGVDLGEHGEIPVDEHCRVAEGVWAVGDVTGIMPFTARRHLPAPSSRSVGRCTAGRGVDPRGSAGRPHNSETPDQPMKEAPWVPRTTPCISRHRNGSSRWPW